MAGIFRTWIEVDKKALCHNAEQFLKLIPGRTRFMAVVKSNAYGHGLVQVAKVLANQPRIESRIIPNVKNDIRDNSGKNSGTISDDPLWFGVDSIVEALRLRREGIKNPILVLGSTLPSRMPEAADEKIILTTSNFESLSALAKLKKRPEFHIKIDTGMHRQGFLPAEALKLIKLLKRFKLVPQGIFTHFASAKDPAYPTYTLEQFRKFQEVVSKFKKAGFGELIRHAAASGATLLFPQTHLDMVRIGMGLYGYFPSRESQIFAFSLPPAGRAGEGHMRFSKLSLPPEGRVGEGVVLKPVLTWKTIISEIKEIPAGSFVGYDLTERVLRKTKIAVLPVGYWHGYDRRLSSVGEVLVRGKRAKVLGRVSMDMITVDITAINGNPKSKIPNSKVKVGDEVILIGRQGRGAIWADELSLKIGTTPYEFLTRINPLIKRVT